MGRFSQARFAGHFSLRISSLKAMLQGLRGRVECGSQIWEALVVN